MMQPYNIDYARTHIDFHSLKSSKIDYELVKKLSSFGLNQKQIAIALKMKLPTFNKYVQEDEKLRNAIEEGKSELDLTISMGQLRLALPDPENGYPGNAAMLKHLGEVYLGQADKSISIDTNDIEIQLVFGNKKIKDENENE